MKQLHSVGIIQNSGYLLDPINEFDRLNSIAPEKNSLE